MAGWSHLGGKKGFVSGLILSGYGIGGSIFAIWYNYRVDELGEEAKLDKTDGNMYFPEGVGKRYPSIHREVCAGMAILTVVSLIFLTNYRSKKPDRELTEAGLRKNSFVDMSPAKRERLGILL